MKEEFLNKNAVIYLKTGNEKFFRFIYETYYAGLCRLARGYLTDPYLSESIVEDVIYNLWINRENIEIKSSLKNYLFRSVSNRCINYLQLEFVKKEITYSHQDISILNNLWSIDDNNPLEELLEDELTKKIYEAIDKLPPETKQAFCLSRFEGKKYEEIGEIMNLSVNTVKYHIKSAMSKLREYLGPYLSFVLSVITFLLK